MVSRNKWKLHVGCEFNEWTALRQQRTIRAYEPMPEIFAYIFHTLAALYSYVVYVLLIVGVCMFVDFRRDEANMCVSHGKQWLDWSAVWCALRPLHPNILETVCDAVVGLFCRYIHSKLKLTRYIRGTFMIDRARLLFLKDILESKNKQKTKRIPGRWKQTRRCL